ncbi:MAG: glyoxalase [Acidobacteria bacterium]|nr:glyoxalase [Acidobacteriota bacterium]
MNRTQTKHYSETPIGWVIIAVALLLAFLSTAHGQAVSRVESVGFTVSDMDKSLDFYTHVLPFQKVSDVETWGGDIENLSGVFGARVRVVRLKLGDETLELTEYLTPRGRPIPVDSRSNDRWFQHIAIIVSDMDKAYAHLRANKVRHASTGPQTLPSYITAAAGISAFYFKDVDDHVLEILSFPPDKGLSKWHQPNKNGRLFLGIDHTAIVVGDTAKSLEFYRDFLGLTVAGTSDNYGPEQEHLNNVKGARLHITGLKTSQPGIAVEFLEYKAPADGRPFPADSRSNDLWHWQTTFAAPDISSALSSYKPLFVSEGIVGVADPKLGIKEGTLIRDPDGHAVRLIGQSDRAAGLE